MPLRSFQGSMRHMDFAIELGRLHESGTYVRLLPPGADLFPRQ
ncbi:hypothetical protein ABIB00_003364 [Bradyrhizobium sp. LB14.3]|nr:hypothetical protein [Bradyrhizobium sp. 197]